MNTKRGNKVIYIKIKDLKAVLKSYKNKLLLPFIIIIITTTITANNNIHN